MKKIIYCLSFLAFAFTACSIDEIDYFDTDYVYLQFEEEEYNASGLKFVDVENPVFGAEAFIHGLPLSDSIEYKVSVDTSSTAIEGVHFELFDQYFFPADTLYSTIKIMPKYTDDMDTTSYYLVLNIENLGNLMAGPIAQASIKIDMQVFQPDWWTTSSSSSTYYIYRNLLGTYSDIKYKLFIQATGIMDMTDWAYADALAACITFSKWLEENGPFYESNGTTLVTIYV